MERVFALESSGSMTLLRRNTQVKRVDAYPALSQVVHYSGSPLVKVNNGDNAVKSERFVKQLVSQDQSRCVVGVLHLRQTPSQLLLNGNDADGQLFGRRGCNTCHDARISTLGQADMVGI